MRIVHCSMYSMRRSIRARHSIGFASVPDIKGLTKMNGLGWHRANRMVQLLLLGTCSCVTNAKILGSVDGGNSTTVNNRAGASITLSPGFNAVSGSSFNAKIQSCN
jgi:hypothetical protein